MIITILLQEISDDEFDISRTEPQRFSQAELSDLIRDLNLSKESSEVLASRLKEKNVLEPGTLVTYYRNRDAEFSPFFKQTTDLVYCSDPEQVLLLLGVVHYNASNWRLFIDSSKRSLKCVLLHNTNAYASIPIGHSTTLKEKHQPIKEVIEKINYAAHNWTICVDLKMVNFLLGQQSGYTKYPCFLCLWDSRAKLEQMRVDENNVLCEQLVPRDRIIFPPLHIKLGLMKQFVKALNKEGTCFQYICKTFPGLTIEKLKAGVFHGPDIRKLIQDENFVTSMNQLQSKTWRSFVAVTQNFLGNKRSDDYVALVENMLNNYRDIGANMSIKVHFLHSHLDRFPENCGDVSDEQGERFHQDIKEMKERYQGRWDTTMMSDYCWSLKRDDEKNYSRQSPKRKFLPKMSSSFRS